MLKTGSFILQRCFINFEESIYRPQLSTDYPKPNIMDIIQTTYKRRSPIWEHLWFLKILSERLKKKFKREKNEIWSGSGDSPANLRKVTTSLSPSKKTKQTNKTLGRWKGIGLAEGSPADYLKSIFLPSPNYLRVFRPFFVVSLNSPFRNKSLHWIDPLKRQLCPFMGSETKILVRQQTVCWGAIIHEMGRAPFCLQRETIGRRHSSENALQINLNFIRKEFFKHKSLETKYFLQESLRIWKGDAIPLSLMK